MSDIIENAQQAAYGLARIGSFVRSEQWQRDADRSLTPTQQGVLVALRRRGTCRLQAIAEQLGISAPTASEVVRTLQRKGLVAKAPDASDGRALRICLSAAGQRAADALDRMPETLLAALGALDEEETEVVHRALTKVILSLQTARAIDPQRLCVTCKHFRPNVHRDARKPHHCTFVDAAFGDAELRLDCGDHDAADGPHRERTWNRFRSPVPAP